MEHGKWIVIDDDYTWDEEADDEVYVVLECECSVCHKRIKADRPDTCPSCEAKMDLGDYIPGSPPTVNEVTMALRMFAEKATEYEKLILGTAADYLENKKE